MIRAEQLPRLRLLAWLLLLVGTVTTIGFVAAFAVVDAEMISPVWPILLWLASPYLLLACGLGWLARSRGRAFVLLAAAAGVSLGGAVLLFDAFVIRPDTQSALVLLLMPAYQCVLALLALLVVGVLHLRPGAVADASEEAD